MNCTLEPSRYKVRPLLRQDTPALQLLSDECRDYALLEQGCPFSPNAALEEFDALPTGKTKADKFLFGAFNEAERIVSLIECIRHYPDEQTYWLGLMLVTPQQRGQGLGTQFYNAFERWVNSQGVPFIQLGVLEENTRGLHFWQRLGFQETRRTEPIQRGDKTHTILVLCREVAPT